jgi:transcriptional regulator with XRE-family HTH domain
MHITAETKAAVGAKLKAFRSARGLSADTVAREALGYPTPNHAAITRLEQGELARVSVSSLQKLANYYGTSVGALLPPGVTLDDLAEATLPRPQRLDEGASGSQRGLDAGVPDALSHARVPSAQARIRRLRLDTGLDISAFAAKLSASRVLVTAFDVAEWESASRRPTSEQFDVLAQMTGVTVHWIKTGRELPSGHDGESVPTAE